MKAKAKNGSDLAINCADVENINTLVAGYVITVNGELIVVEDKDDHSSIFSDYINHYEGKSLEDFRYYESIEGAKYLVENDNIVYFGLKIKDTYVMRSNTGYGIILLPSSLNFNEKQAYLLKKLIESNKSIFSGNKIELQVSTFEAEKVMSIDDLMELATEKSQRIRKK